MKQIVQRYCQGRIQGDGAPPFKKFLYKLFLPYTTWKYHQGMLNKYYSPPIVHHMCINLFYKCDYPSAYPSLLP